VLLIRRYKLPFGKVMDAFAPGVALGQAIGREGCFAAGCCWGKPTTLPWGVEFGELAHRITGVPVDVHLHPTQLYESFASALLFLFLYRLHRRKRFTGEVIAAYAVLYGLIRFLIEFVRDDPRGDIFGLTSLTGLSTSQLISLFVIVGGIIFLVRRRRRANREDATPKGDDAATTADTARA
jgi:phosphatidylglycerol:prolipoprotein diacylglycerol transferase